MILQRESSWFRNTSPRSSVSAPKNSLHPCRLGSDARARAVTTRPFRFSTSSPIRLQLPLPYFAMLWTMSMSQPLPIPNVWILMLSFWVFDLSMTALRSETWPSVSMKIRVSLWPLARSLIACESGARILVPPMSALISLIWLRAFVIVDWSYTKYSCCFWAALGAYIFVYYVPKLIIWNLQFGGRLWMKSFIASLVTSIRRPDIEPLLSTMKI